MSIVVRMRALNDSSDDEVSTFTELIKVLYLTDRRMLTRKQKLIYLSVLIVNLLVEANLETKIILSSIILVAAYGKQKRNQQLSDQIIQKHQANRLFIVLLTGTLLLHFLDSKIRVFVELTYLITIISWLLQSIRLNQKHIFKALFIIMIAEIMLMALHIQLNVLGIELYSVSAYAIYALPLLLIKLFVELRILSKEFREASEGLKQKVYDPNENNWFASTFGIISHNLKTPLASIQGQCDIIRLKLNATGSNHLETHLEHIDNSLNATKSQLEQTISTFKTRINLMHYPEPSMIVLVDQLKSEYPDSIELEGSIPALPLSTNEFFALNLALQVVQDNALKYGRGPVRWKFKDYGICIKDQGAGFSENMITTQGNEMQHSSKTGGVGIYYAKSILFTVGWTLQLSNQEGACVQLKKGPVTERQMAKIW